MIFEKENWLWKSKLCDLYSQIQNLALICQKPFKVRKLINLGFDAEVAEKFLNGIYTILQEKNKCSHRIVDPVSCTVWFE